LGVKRFDCAIGGEDCRVVALLPLTLLYPEHDPDGPLTHYAPPREFEGTPRQSVTQKVTGVFCALSYLPTMHGGGSLSLRHTLSQVACPPANLSKQVTWTMCISRISCPFCTQFPSVPQILLTKVIWHYNGFSAVSKVLSQQ